MRTITIDITPEDFLQLGRNTEHVHLTDTIGYFTTYGIRGGQFDTVRILMDWHSKTDLIAIYSSTENPDSRFTMGAVWREDEGKFTYHS